MAKKSFNNDMPALGFISEPAAAQPKAGTTIEVPAGYKVNHAVIETKSKRVQVLMQPSLHSRIKAAAAAQGISVNDYIHKALEAAVEQE